MKYVVFSLLLIISIRTNTQKALSKREITFDKYVIDPNEMIQNKNHPETYNYTIHFENTGDQPVIFTRCQCPCGCYIINDFPKEKLKPGDKGELKVSFWYRSGVIDKSVFLHTNIPDENDESGFKRYEFKVKGEFKK